MQVHQSEPAFWLRCLLKAKLWNPGRPAQAAALLTWAVRSMPFPLSPAQASEVAKETFQLCYVPGWPDRSL